MRRTVRITVTGVLAAVLVAAFATVAVAKEVSTKRYAKTLCGAYQSLGDAEQAYNTTYAEIPADPAGFQAAVATAASELGTKVDTLQAKLTKVSPRVEDGKKISKLFARNLDEVSKEIADALAALQAADPNGATFSTDISTYETALSEVDTKPSDPFKKLKDQEVIAALDDEKSCNGVVTIVSG